MKSKEEKSNPIYPEGLKTGDQVCIIDPANAFTEEALDAAASHLEARGVKGYRVRRYGISQRDAKGACREV